MPSPITRRFDGERILLTGATGFLAKSLLERILAELPCVGHVHLLVRPKHGRSLSDRLAGEILSSDVFDPLRRELGVGFEAFVAEKISVVGGDLTKDRLGLEPNAYEDLARDVTLVLNCAALSSFDAPLDRALQANTLGARRILEFARAAGDVPLVHVSTCYVNTAVEGLVVEESLASNATPDLDADVQWMLETSVRVRTELGARGSKQWGREQARKRGWNDVYVLSKALGEQLLSRDHGAVPLAIVRPSIVESTWEAPFPGWLDGIRMVDPVIVEYGRGNFRRFVGSPEMVIDLVPCDMVSNLVLAAVPPRDAAGLHSIYQLASSTWNPVTVDKLTGWAFEAFTELAERYPEQVSAPARRGQWVGEERFRRELRRRRGLLNGVKRIQEMLRLDRAVRRSVTRLRIIAKAEQLTDLYAYYACTSPRFDVARTKSLWDGLDAEDRRRFPFDVSRVEWRDYLKERHIPGLLRLSGFDSSRS